MAENERMPATLAKARDALWRAWYEVAHGGVRLDETGGAEAVARLVLADPDGWRKALGWGDEWGWDTHGYRCTRCGIRVGLPESPELCAGVPS